MGWPPSRTGPLRPSGWGHGLPPTLPFPSTALASVWAPSSPLPIRAAGQGAPSRPPVLQLSLSRGQVTPLHCFRP